MPPRDSPRGSNHPKRPPYADDMSQFFSADPSSELPGYNTTGDQSQKPAELQSLLSMGLANPGIAYDNSTGAMHTDAQSGIPIESFSVSEETQELSSRGRKRARAQQDNGASTVDDKLSFVTEQVIDLLKRCQVAENTVCTQNRVLTDLWSRLSRSEARTAKLEETKAYLIEIINQLRRPSGLQGNMNPGIPSAGFSTQNRIQDGTLSGSNAPTNPDTWGNLPLGFDENSMDLQEFNGDSAQCSLNDPRIFDFGSCCPEGG
nr:hypothetical protein L204_06489 [Cryptococcus depauperatus CBS 7855]